MNKLDLELFDILNSEIDKTLSFWCVITENYEWKDYMYTIVEICNNNEKYYYIRHMDWVWNFNKTKTEIIWHYPTCSTVLRYCLNNKCGISDYDSWTDYWYIEIDNRKTKIILDITKEIINYTDEQKQELINFLKTL